MLGDYVQKRGHSRMRGDIVRIDRDGWCMVNDLRTGGFFEEHEKNLVVLVRKDRIGDL